MHQPLDNDGQLNLLPASEVGGRTSQRFPRVLTALKDNLWAGMLLLCFRKSAFSRFRCDYDQAALIVLIDLIVTIVAGYLRNLPNPSFNVYAFESEAVGLSCVLLLGYIIAKSVRNNAAAMRFLVPMYSASPAFYAVWVLLHLGGAGTAIGNQWIYLTYSVFSAWAIAVTVFILLHLCGGKKLLALGHLVLYLILVSFVAYISDREFWYASGAHSSTVDSDAEQVNVESVYYSQLRLVQDATAKLLPGRPGIPDIYFVGFAGYANQDVFMKEVRFAKDLFDRRFDTQGRSIILVNNRDTIKDTPIASHSNLRMVLEHVGQIMDREEDVLFLFMTSHGSKTHELSTQFWPLQLNLVSAGDLKSALDEAGIKWRVLTISACYSGGFIDPLKNKHTMIMTAAAHDKQSFGCGHENEFTYFGREMFDNQLTQEISFKTAFANAARSVRDRELQENLNPSEPQLFVGQDIEKKLEVLEHRLTALVTPDSTRLVPISGSEIP